MSLGDEDAATAALAAELAGKHEVLTVGLQPNHALAITALLQLATRHPRVSLSLRVTAAQFLAGVREYFADCPTALDVVTRGDDRGQDTPTDVGGTGLYPHGRIDPTDEGEISVGLAADYANGVIKLSFGKPTAWLGIPPAHARSLGRALIAKADDLDRRRIM